MYKKGFDGWRKHLDFMAIDMLCMIIALWGAFITRHGFKEAYFGHIPYYMHLMAVLLVVSFLVAYFFNTFSGVIRRGYYKELLATLRHIALVVLIAFFYLFSAKKTEDYSRIILYLFGIYYFVLSYSTRVLWRKHLWKQGDKNGERSILLITESDQVSGVLESLRTHKGEQLSITGVVLLDKECAPEAVEGIPVVSDLKNVVNYVCREWVDEVFIRTTGQSVHIEKLTEQFLEMGVTVHQGLFRNEDADSERKQFVEKLGNYTVLTSSINAATPFQLFAKRTLDIMGGIVGCICTGLIYIVIAPMIKRESPGPVFFSQTRIGKNGRKFKIYKFRSMYLDAEERKKELMEQNRVKDGFMFKLDFDPRIIGSKKLPDGTVKRGIGNIIRDYSLDEFPQFYNVLKGDMSLVGTRPPTVDEWEKYELHHRARLATKPGITGMWQVSGRSNITDFEEVVKLDTKYITEWSFGLDVKILFKTVLSVVKREGSM
mgnify:FL=1